VGDPGLYGSLALSPNEKRVAFERPDPQGSAEMSISLYDFERGLTSGFTSASVRDWKPVWSPDSSRIAYESIRSEATRALSNGLFEKNSPFGGKEHLLFPGGKLLPSDWSHDRRFLLCYFRESPYGLALLSFGQAGADSRLIPLGRTQFRQESGRFSPDGRWIAYASNEFRKDEIYVRPFDGSAAVASSSTGSTPETGRVMVSKDGGRLPLWPRHGTELFYLGSDGYVKAVHVNTSGVFHAGIPKSLFKAPAKVLSWDVSSDGTRFLMVVPSTQSSSAQPPFNLVVNWQAALTK
jgi:Tol biopolymer transport system component